VRGGAGVRGTGRGLPWHRLGHGHRMLALVVTLVLISSLCSPVVGERTLDLWRRALNIETLKVDAAQAILKETSQEEGAVLCGARLGSDEDVPALHYMLYVYFRSGNDLAARRALVSLLTQCIEKHGADVSESYNQDPSILFKALLLREMSLAKVIAEQSGAALATRAIFSHLYAVPCEVVPLSKLLLHAATIISKKGLEQLGGLDGLKRLIAGASLGGQNKPAVKGGDLAALAPTYHSTLQEEGFASKGYRLRLQGLVRVLDEVASATHGAILSLSSSTGSSSAHDDAAAVVAALAEADKGTLRNSLHHLAISGAVVMIAQLADFASRPLSQTTSSALGLALLAPDRHGMIPSAYTLVRFGRNSQAFEAMLRLCAAASASVEAACKSEHPEIRLSKSTPEALEVTVEADGGSGSGSGSGDGDEVVDFGGWNPRRLEQPELLGEEGRCDILQVRGPPPSREEFYRRFVLTNTPVVFRDAARGSSLQQAFRRDAFIRRYGNVTVEVGSIPYPSSFGVAGSPATLKNVADLEGPLAGATANPNYAFTVPSPRWRAQLGQDCPLPAFVPIQAPAAGGGSEDHEIQFYLGPAGSGAPVHFHGHAVNSMAYGEKKWFLFPPGSGFYSTLPALEFVRNDSASQGASWQCTQRSGDVVYVPTLWSHATLNVRQSVGVAHEFSIEPYCME